MDGRTDDRRTDEHLKFGGYNMIIYIFINAYANFIEIRLFILDIEQNCMLDMNQGP